jgi:hypothetical protein
LFPPESTPSRSAITRPEAIVAAALLLGMVVLRWLYRKGHPWDSDETQHLHVVWAWATGHLQYRDVFDNHSPLFHCLNAPFLAAFGERADIVEPMRFFAMTPLWLICLWGLRSIGTSLLSASNGLWTALLGAVCPPLFFIRKSEPFFVKMVEFRTDVMWVTAWVLTVAILIGGPPTVRRMFYAGLLLGTCFAVSMKSVLLLVTILIAAAGAGIVHLFLREKTAPRAGVGVILGMMGAALAGLAIVPALLIAWFAAHHALAEMYYCIITHNAPPGSHSASQTLHQLKEMRAYFRWMLVPACAAALLLRKDPPRAIRATFLLLLAGSFYPVLHGIWSKFSAQDYMPWFPLLAVLGAPLVLLLGHGLSKAVRFVPPWVLPTCLTIGLLVQIVLTQSPLGHPNRDGIRLIDQVLRLTKPGETVCDAKGESVFRPRSYYYVLETLTRKSLYDGTLIDTLPEDCIAHGTTVVHRLEDRMMPGSLAFIDTNYVSIGLLSVLGKKFEPDGSGVAEFDLAIPETFRVISREAGFTGTLDGQPCDDTPRALAKGHHELRRSAGTGPVAVIWSRAIEQGFTPFPLTKMRPVEKQE